MRNTRESIAVVVAAGVLVLAGLAVQPPAHLGLAARQPGEYHRHLIGSRIPLCEEYCAGAFPFTGNTRHCPRCDAIARELEESE